MIALMMLTFLFFFGFVVNTGVLVNAKINLQNAADLAAYAGAATQARQLNQISFLNYEMRRQYKKFMYRYYVLGNMAQKAFPRGEQGAPVKLWSPDGGDPAYNVPVVCVAFNADDNYCQVRILKGISIPAPTTFDAINDALIENLKKIENIRQANCQKIAFTNSQLLHLWLWNTDPDFSTLNSDIFSDSPELQQSISVIRSLAYGLGLVPKEILLRRRIETLADFINEEPKSSVSIERVNSLRKNVDSAAHERTIQAYLSAFYTLSNHTFDSSSIQMDELLPDRLIALKNISVKFDAYALTFTDGESREGGARDCEPGLIVDGVGVPLPVGVYKDPALLTYYAVRLKAKAKLLFSPFGDSVELSAYSAAQPFGSRIGPSLSENDFIKPDATPQVRVKFQQPIINRIPNLRITDDDSTAAEGGWNNPKVVGALYQALAKPESNGTLPASISPSDMARAYHVAMAPNPFEASKYNIPYDKDDPFVRHFDSQGTYSFYAPIFPESKIASMSSEIESMFSSFFGQNPSPDQIKSKEKAKVVFNQYLGRLLQGKGEPIDFHPAAGGAQASGEGFRIAQIADPVHTRPSDGGGSSPVILSAYPTYVLTDPKQIKSSWNDVLDETKEKTGRVGYSVKFVAFEYLRSGKALSTGNEAMKNTLPSDAGTDADIPHLKH